MGIIRSNNPADFDDLDGIVVDESAPSPSIRGVSTNVAILVGQFERGPINELTAITSTGQLHELFGKSNTYAGNIALKNKKFGSLKVIRVSAASGGALGTYTFDDGDSTDIIKFDAKYKGAYGNSITVTIAAGSSSGSKYTIIDDSSNPVLPTEVYDNVVISAVGTTFANSKLVDVTVLATSAEPDPVSATNLASGSDGSIADTDYQTAIAVAEAANAGNILFLDSYNATRNGYIKTHIAATTDKMGILAGSETETVAEAITAVGSMRDTEGRLIYAYNWLKTTVGGVATYTSPAPWLASILSQTHPSIDPAYSANTQYLAGVSGVKNSLSRTSFISLKDAGIAAFEFDSDIGFKLKSGVVTQIADSSKITILRRRMADYLTNSVAFYLKSYQNAPNTKKKRDAVAGAIQAFIAGEERNGVLPKDNEVLDGVAKLVDTESLNTNDSIAAGYFYILWRQRIYSSMRFIVLRAEVGESVVVTAD